METPSQKKLYRSRKLRMLAGVAGGVAEYFKVDVTIIRLLFVLFGFMSAGTAIFLYILAAIVIPEEPVAGSVK